jgi:hypothetical protein
VKTIRSRALELLTLRLLVMQLALAVISALLFILWLRVPDANFAEVAFSVLLGLLLLGIAMGGEAAILLRIRSLPLSRTRILRDAAILVAAILIWYGWSALIDQLSVHDVLRAGYLNSRFPHAYRNFFSYPHLLTWFGWLWSTLRWLGAGLLLAFAVAAVQTPRFIRAGLRTFFSASYWVVLFCVAVLTSFITGVLLSWTPGQGPYAEMVSLALRLVAIGIIDLILYCYLLTTASAVVEYALVDRYDAPAGTPAVSQPRTEEKP